MNVIHLYLILQQWKKSRTIVSSESEVVSTSDTEEEEDMYFTVSEDEDNPSNPRLELIDKQFNLKMKELFPKYLVVN